MSAVTLTLDNEIAHIHFDDGKANVLNGTSLNALEDAFSEAETAKAVVFSGREGTFSGGLDLKTLPTLSALEFRATLAQFGRFCQRLLVFPRPVVAAVTGHAIAGGTVLLLCCDHRIGEDRAAKIGLSEVPIGMPVPRFVIHLAKHGIAKDHLTEAVLHGKLYSPQEASQMGYLQSVVPAGHAIVHAQEMAAQLSTLPNPAYQLTKERLTASIVAALDSFQDETEFFLTSFIEQAARKSARAAS